MINQSEIEKTIRLLATYVPQVEAAQNHINELNRQTTPYLQTIIRDALKRQAIVANIVKRRELEKRVLTESGWWLSPTVMELPVGPLDSAINRYLDGDKSAITDFFLSLLDHTDFYNLDWMVGHWEKNNFFSPWKKAIDEAVNAFKSKEYYLSIPVCLLVAEGIATEFCKSNTISVNKNRGNEKITESVKYAETTGVYFPRSEILFMALERIIYAGPGKCKTVSQYFLNRHSIIHGLDSGYGVRENAVKAFLLVDVLSILA